MFYISDEIKKETDKCRKDFSCLSEKGCDLCKVVSCFDCDAHFIYCMNEDCSYQNKIGERTICDCPVRKNIYYKYNV